MVNTSNKFRQTLTKPVHPNGNPEFDFWFPEWAKMRDVILGQKQLRAMGTTYLPAYASMTADEYMAYLSRTAFYNMTQRTMDGMLGTAFLRDPKVKGLKPKQVEGLKKISKKGSSLLTFTKQICEEVLKVGRVGVLCDMGADGGTPFLLAYMAENIVDWSVSNIGGREVLSMVALREQTRDVHSTHGYTTSYRVLKLVGGEYQQHMYDVDDHRAAVDFRNQEPDSVTVPTRRGTAFDYIPFKLFGPRSNEPEVEKPPLLDIADLNLAHYQSSAQLEQGRWYTGLPIYYSEIGPGGEQADYQIAPNVVWQLTPGAKAGIIEFNGSGLKFLENALREKENQISALGGRMITNRADSTGKSEEETKMNERNERSLLMNIAVAMDEGFTELLQWWTFWQDVNDVSEVHIKFNKDFMLDALGAREFRAIESLYKEGILPIRAVHEVFQRINIIPDDMDLEAFIAALDDPKSFPNNPDIKAMREGFPDAKAKFDHDEAALADERVVAAASEAADVDKDAAAEQAKVQEKAATKVAAATKQTANQTKKTASGSGKPGNG